jgi:ankyrin repeat protein
MAKLTIDAIATSLTIRDLKLSLRQIANGLHVAYDATIQRILCQGEGRSQRAFKVMNLMLLAQRPLTSAEMEHAVSIEQGSQDIDLDDIVPAPTLASLCAGLVAIDQHGDFRFAHQTVSEYLRVSHRDRLSDADTSFANSCLTYLMYTTFASGPCAELDTFEGRLSQYPLYSYCSRYWYKQLSEIPNAEQKRLALKFFGSGPHWRSARQAARSIESEPEDFLTPQHLRGETTLHYAAYLDAHHLFEHLLEENPLALNKQNELGRTPLMEAVVSGSLKFASKLIKAGAKTNVADTDGKTALHLAGWVENLAMVDLLVTNPSVDVNLRVAKTSNLSSGDTALTRAARDGAGGIVRRLIEAGADVNAFNDTGFSALHMAAMNGNLQIVEILVNAPQIDINSLSRKSRFSVGDASAVTMAAWGGHAETVKELLKAGADPGDEALYLAVMRGNAAVVEALLQFNAEIDILRESSAFENDCLSILMIAILGKSMQILKALLSKGCPNINLQSRKGKTALMVAMKAKKIETARLLLSHEVINVNLADDDGWTPLMVAADTGLSEIVPELVAKGANVNAQSNAGWTPILLAAKGNHIEVVRMLLSFDCIVVNAIAEPHGRTALHYAVSWANTTLVELLLFKRADLQIQDKANGLRAVDYALYFNDKNILDLLETGGGGSGKHKARNE